MMKKATEIDEADADEVNKELRLGGKHKVTNQTGGEQGKKSERNLKDECEKQELSVEGCGSGRRDKGPIRFEFPHKGASEENERMHEAGALHKLKCVHPIGLKQRCLLSL